MVERETVRSLLETIERRLGRLRRASETSLEAYLDDSDLQDVVERNFELAIQACLDLGLHVLADSAAPLPSTNREVFRRLESEGAIAADLAERLGDMAGFRNLLAHEYASLIPELVHGHLDRLDDIEQYVARMLEHLEGGD